jgi:MHS family proline/betaine transporter-like MFS transporter
MEKKHKIIAAALTGNLVEYYDFGIYAVFAGIIGSLFFPPVNEALELILAFAVFSLGFMMRPLGALFFGYVGDRFGRKKALVISMLGMSISTLCLGLLPGYQEIGLLAPLALLIIRMVQGFCIGGEGTGSAIFILEHLEKGRLGLLASLVMTSNLIGTLVANLVALALDKQIGIDNYTWRYCFFLGAFLGFIGLYFRLKNKETPAFERMKAERKERKQHPVAELLQKKKYAMISIIAIAASATSLMYLVRGYLGVFLSDILNFSQEEALIRTIFALSALSIFMPFCGYLVDKIGTKKLLNYGLFATLVFIIPAWHLVISERGILQYCGLTMIAMMGAMMGAPAYPKAINLFPPAMRYSGMSLAWNIGNAIFGGTTPLIASLLYEKIGPMGPALYLVFTASIFIILRSCAFLYLKKKKI